MLMYYVYTALFRPFPPGAASLDRDREQALKRNWLWQILTCITRSRPWGFPPCRPRIWQVFQASSPPASRQDSPWRTCL